MKTRMTLEELERELLQEQLNDFSPEEREWFAEGEEMSRKAERQIAAWQESSN